MRRISSMVEGSYEGMYYHCGPRPPTFSCVHMAAVHTARAVTPGTPHLSKIQDWVPIGQRFSIDVCAEQDLHSKECLFRLCSLHLKVDWGVSLRCRVFCDVVGGAAVLALVRYRAHQPLLLLSIQI